MSGRFASFDGGVHGRRMRHPRGLHQESAYWLPLVLRGEAVDPETWESIRQPLPVGRPETCRPTGHATPVPPRPQ